MKPFILNFYQNLSNFWGAVHILEGGIDVNAVNSRKETPFALAIQKQLLKVAFLLLENEAKPEIQDEDGDNALHLLAMEKRTWYSRLLDQHDPFLKSLTEKQISQFIENDNNHKKDFLLSLAKAVIEKARGTSLLTARNNKGDQPLHTAIRYGFPSLAKLIMDALEQEENVDWNAQGNSMETYLSLAIKKQLPSIARRLLEKKAKPEIQDENGNNALHLLASGWGKYDHNLRIEYETELGTLTRKAMRIPFVGDLLFHSHFEKSQMDIEKGILAFTQDLIKAAEGTNLLTARNNEGKLPIQVAMDNHFTIELAELIIEQGGAEALTEEEHNSLIQKAIQKNWLRILQLLRRESNMEPPPFNPQDDPCHPSFTAIGNNQK